MNKSKKVTLFFIVLSITLYGVWCIWEYFLLVSAGRLASIYRPSELYMVPIIGIWLSWSGLRKIFNAGQDWDRTVGYENRWWRGPYYNYKFILICFGTVK